MSSSAYLVKLTANQSDQTRVWNTRKPLKIGHPARWTMEKAEGGVRLRSLEKQPMHFFKDEEIAGSASLILIPGGPGREEFRLELRQLNQLTSAAAEQSMGGSRIRIFERKGPWLVDTQEIRGLYVGRSQSKKVFEIQGNVSGTYGSTDAWKLTALVGGIRVSGQILARGESRSVSAADSAALSITYQGAEWTVSAAHGADPFVDSSKPKDDGGEALLFKRAFTGSLAAFAAALLLTWLIPSSPIEPKKDEPVRILLSQKKPVRGLMTAAPKGNSRAKDLSIGKAGVAKNAGRKGAVQVAKAKSTKKRDNPPSRVARVAQAVAKSSAQPRRGKATRGYARVAKATPSRAQPKPVPLKESELQRTFASASFKKATAGLVSGGISAGKVSYSDTIEEARAIGNSRGTGGSGVGSVGSVSTRSAAVSGFGGGSRGDGGPGSSGAGYGQGSYSKVSGQGKSFVSLDTSASEVDEGLTRDQVGRVIHAHMHEIRYCYEAAFLRDNDLEGRMHVQFSIAAPGNVRTASVGQTTVSDRRLQQCITSRLRQWKFPKPKGGVTVAVNYPFMFKSITR